MIFPTKEMISAQSSRDLSLDQLKFVLVFLVALFHAIEPYAESCLYVFNLVYVFHMPLFVLISGYFANFTTREKLVKSTVSLLETYLLLCFIITVVFKSSFLKEIFFPSFSNWFILSLIFWRVGLFYFKQILSKCRIDWGGVILIFSVIIAIVSYIYLPYGVFLSLQRTMQFFPFFVIGYLLNSDNLDIIRKKSYLFGIIAIISIIGLSFFNQENLRWINYAYKNVNEIALITGSSITELIVSKPFAVLIGLIICLFCLSIRKVNKYMAYYGRYTLFLYVFQMFFIHFPARANIYNSEWISIICGLLLFFLGMLLAPSKIASFATNPITSIINKIRHRK